MHLAQNNISVDLNTLSIINQLSTTQKLITEKLISSITQSIQIVSTNDQSITLKNAVFRLKESSLN